MSRGNRSFAAFVLLWIISVGVLGYEEHEIDKKATKHESAETCKVQDRGLKANAHLLHAMLDVETLLPHSATVTNPTVRLVYESFQEELMAYTALQRRQPVERRC
jgi:hypothetical protein